MQRHLSIIVAAAFALASCGDDGAGSTDEAGRERVVVVGSQWYGHCPAWVGIEQGIFEKAGFAVEWKPVANSVDRLLAISSGDAQFASLGEIAMLTQMANGNESFWWVGNQDIAPGFEGIVAREGIATTADLRGKRIGLQFASSVDITTRLLLAEAGLDPATDVELLNMKATEIPQAFRSGAIDAGVIWEPQFSDLKSVEGATVLAMDTDTVVYEEYGTMTGPDVLVIGRAWADADPDRARRFLAAYFECVAWVRDNPAEAAVLVADYVKQPADVIEANLRKFVWNDAAAQDRILSDEGMYGQAAYVARLMQEDMGVIPSVPDFRAWVRRDLVPGLENVPAAGESAGK